MEGTKARRCALGMPGYDFITGGASRAFHHASQTDAKIPLTLNKIHAEGSLLAQNFNALWCQALNLHQERGDLRYFAMLHTDVEPEDCWLDILIEELEARELDVLGAVVPIKDPKGLTSIALDRPKDDPKYPWFPLCRLTMREVFTLPETFTAADCGHPVLLNTGCWVCRWNQEWAEKVFFTINDRIAKHPKTGQYYAIVEPEDWFFSRACNDLGLKIGATRKVRLNHTGKSHFIAFEPWGSEHFDSAFVAESVLPERPPTIRFPEDVEGWLLHSEGMALAELAKDKRVLEIGSYCGKSTICLAQTAKKVHSVDPHDGRGTGRPKPTLCQLKENLERYGVADKVAAYHGTIDDVRPLLRDGTYDLIFIDGAHDEASVNNDVRHAMELLAPDGLLAFHDYRRFAGQHDGRWDPGVNQAVDALVAAGGELITTYSTVAVVKPPVPVPVLENCNG